jgi:hypothetical protein
MIVLCCYTAIKLATLDALEKYSFDNVHYVCVEDDPFGYWREIKARWNGKEDLVVVEQDVEIHDTVLTDFMECKEPWCCFSYQIFGQRNCSVGLGCTKFSAQLQQEISLDVLTERFARCEFCEGKGCWWHLDGPILQLLQSKGYNQHIHQPEVTHHHDYEADTGDVVRERTNARAKSPLSVCALTGTDSWPGLCDVCDNLPDKKTGCIRYKDWCAYPVIWDDALAVAVGYLVRQDREIKGAITMKVSGQYELDYDTLYDNYYQDFADFNHNVTVSLPYEALVIMAGSNA